MADRQVRYIIVTDTGVLVHETTEPARQTKRTPEQPRPAFRVQTRIPRQSAAQRMQLRRSQT